MSFDLQAGEVDRRTFEVVLAPNASTEIWKGQVPGQPIRRSLADPPRPIVVQARLLDRDSSGKATVLARYSSWPEPFKFLTFPKYDLKTKVNGDEVTLKTDKPIKGIVLDVEGDVEECEWSDQAIDLMPGDEQVVVAKGLGGRRVKARVSIWLELADGFSTSETGLRK